MDHKFLQKVQASEFKHPTQRGFSINEWRENFNSINHPTNEDRRINEAGIWFDDRLTTIRNKLKEYAEPGLTVAQLKQLYVGVANREFKVGMVAQEEYIEKKEATILVEDLIEQQLSRGCP